MLPLGIGGGAQAPTASAQSSILPSDWAPPRTVYIPETGHSIDGWFLDLWREAGGAAAYGYPITPEITREDGSIVQYYQYARFEYWPYGDENGNLVTVGDIGYELRPTIVPRLPVGGAAHKNADMTRIAMAWLPLPESQIKPDSETYRYIPETGHSIYDGFKAFWEQSGAEWYLGYPISEEYVVDGVHYQVFERGQLRWEQGGSIEMVPVGQLLADRYRLPQAPTEQGDLPVYDEALFIPPPPPTPEEYAASRGADPNAERWIEINLTTQYLIAWQGDVAILETYISSGRDHFATPPGTFFINSKLPVQDMEGVIGGEYYNVPQVPDVMYFTDRGHAIHGTYWHNSFGTPMSHGCINVPLDYSKFLYDWTPLGARVEIHF